MGTAIRPDVCTQPTVEAIGEPLYVVISLYPVVGVTLEWCWLVLPAHCQACATSLDGLLPRVRWRGKVHQRMWGQSVWCQQGLHWSAMGGDLQATRKTAQPGWLEWVCRACKHRAHDQQAGWRVFLLCWFPQVSMYLGCGAGEGNGNGQLLCSCVRLPKTPIASAHALKLVNKSPSCTS